MYDERKGRKMREFNLFAIKMVSMIIILNSTY